MTGGFRAADVARARNRFVIVQHAGDAAHLWNERAAATRSRRYGLRDLARVDLRLEANLHGLALADELGWDAVERRLDDELRGGEDLFAVAVLALRAGRREVLAKLPALALAEPMFRPALISALAWVGPKSAAAALLPMLSQDGAHAALALDAYAAQRIQPLDLDAACARPEPELKRSLARAIGLWGLTDRSRWLEARLDEEDEPARIWAAWSLSLLVPGTLRGVAVLRRAARNARADTPEAAGLAALAAEMLGRVQGERDCISAFEELSEEPATRGLALRVAAAGGWHALIEPVLGLMRGDEEAQARAAGYAFEQITGIDLGFEDLVRAEDPDAERDGDSSLALPDPERVAEHWSRESKRFATHARYLQGRRLDERSLFAALREAPQPMRRAAALELARQHPGRAVYATSKPGHVQARELLEWT